MSDKKIGLVGLGKIGLFHLSILRNLPGVKLVGLVDPVPSAQKMVRGLGIDVPFFPSVSELIDKTQPDGVFACVPPRINRVIAEACIPRGVSLFIEKPMAATADDARAIAALLQKAPKPVSHAVGYMVAYYPMFRQAKKLVESGDLGEIKRYSMSLNLGEVFEKKTGWRQNPSISGGGAVSILGSHLLYLVQDLFGVPQAVSAKITKLFSDVEDICDAQLFHSKDLNGVYHVSWSQPGCPFMEFEIKIEGTKNTCEVRQNHIKMGNKEWFPWDMPEHNPFPNKLDPGQPGYATQDADFVASIGGSHKPLVTWNGGLNVQRLIDAIYASNGHRVEVK